MRPGFSEIVDGWTLIDGLDDLTDRIERAAEWTKANGPLLADEEATVKLMIEAQIARGIDEFGPDEASLAMGCEDEGTCPNCGDRLRYREVIPEADVGCNYCPGCGWEGGVS